jgi:hypothetical protein
MKQYNPNTKYGQKKMREQLSQKVENMSDDEKNNHNSGAFIITLIIAILGLLIFGSKWFH